MSTLVLSGDDHPDLTIVHLVTPSERVKEAESHPQKAAVAGTLPRETSLTKRESTVLVLLAEGSTTAQIASSLYISPATVRNHIQSILHKLEAHNRLEAVSQARRQGII